MVQDANERQYSVAQDWCACQTSREESHEEREGIQEAFAFAARGRRREGNIEAQHDLLYPVVVARAVEELREGDVPSCSEVL